GQAASVRHARILCQHGRVRRRVGLAVLRFAFVGCAFAFVGCARYVAAPRGEFDIVSDPAAGVAVVPRAEPGGSKRVLVRHPDLPGRGLPIVVAVGNVAVFEAARVVRNVEVAGRAAAAWFTPGQKVYVRGLLAGSSKLRLTFAGGRHQILGVEVR
ncbi:MAG: hypothetical protein JWN44_4406, partial [Myxococcales bacterium]|nr:hypothetical protein [Myxococcales bacterium]